MFLQLYYGAPNELNIMESSNYVQIPFESDVRLSIKTNMIVTKPELKSYSSSV